MTRLTFNLLLRLGRGVRRSSRLSGLLIVLTCSGCVSLAEDAAEAPYEKAMKRGRMLPSEFKQQQDAIRRAAEPVK
jgi:hypothetical protein